MKDQCEIIQDAITMVEEGWCQGAPEQVDEETGRVSVCLGSALYRSAGECYASRLANCEEHKRATERVAAQFGGPNVNPWVAVIVFNDAYSTSKEDVLLVLKRALHDHG